MSTSLNVPERYRIILVLPYSDEEAALRQLRHVHLPELIESLGQTWLSTPDHLVLELTNLILKLSRRVCLAYAHPAGIQKLAPTCRLMPPGDLYLRHLRKQSLPNLPGGEGRMRLGQLLWDQLAALEDIPNEL